MIRFGTLDGKHTHITREIFERNFKFNVNMNYGEIKVASVGQVLNDVCMIVETEDGKTNLYILDEVKNIYKIAN